MRCAVGQEKAMPPGGSRMQRMARRRNRAMLAAAAFALWLAAAASPAHAQATPDSSALVQRDVPAEATAENAVVARDRALASGQRIAYERMASQLGLPRNLSDQQIEAQVASLVIESERVTPRGYSARITVNFRPPGNIAAQPGGGGMPGGPAVATMDALAQFRSFPEYLEIRRRLGAAPSVARVELLSVAGDVARFRLALRTVAPTAATELASAGLEVSPGPGGEAWRLGLAPGR
jgi:hypothetical protein